MTVPVLRLELYAAQPIKAVPKMVVMFSGFKEAIGRTTSEMNNAALTTEISAALTNNSSW